MPERRAAHPASRRLPAALLASAMGNMVTATETRSLSADGKEMTVELSVNGNTRKMVYTKGM